MNEINMAFLLTIIAGLSTLIGTIPIFIRIKNIDKFIAASLSFASGVMICVSITDLLPETINMLKKYYNGITVITLTFISLMIGITLSSFLEKNISTTKTKKHSLYKVGIISMIAIIMHNIPEGIATFITTTTHKSLGISLSLAIAFHNIPEGITIAIPIYYSTNNKTKAFTYTLISALSEPIGALLAYLFLLPYINNILLGIIFAIIAGLMIQISTKELLPTSINYNYTKTTKIFFIIGIIFMLLKFFI